jgi:hypothetical protein
VVCGMSLVTSVMSPISVAKLGKTPIRAAHLAFSFCGRNPDHKLSFHNSVKIQGYTKACSGKQSVHIENNVNHIRVSLYCSDGLKGNCPWRCCFLNTGGSKSYWTFFLEMFICKKRSEN